MEKFKRKENYLNETLRLRTKFPFWQDFKSISADLEIKIIQLYQPALCGRKIIYLYSGYIQLILIGLIYKNKSRYMNQRLKTQTLAWEDVA
jgi:hypothetical protein